MDRSKLRETWRKESKRYWDKLRSSRPDEYRKQLANKSLANRRRNFGGNAEIVFERDNRTCQVCHLNKYPLIIHHIDRKNGKLGHETNHSTDNLITLCRFCHEAIQRFAEIKMFPKAHELVKKYPPKLFI